MDRGKDSYRFRGIEIGTGIGIEIGDRDWDRFREIGIWIGLGE